jgi:uncharacterized protein (DUF488 family)
MTTACSPLLLTLGYGKRSIGDVIDLLKQHQVSCLADVRSVPWSRYHPDFSQKALKEHLGRHEIRYLFLGRELGGRPDDPSCYVDGRVDYARCRERPAFVEGIARLRRGWEMGERMALLCSESKPENCHRAKLLGPVLVDAGIGVTHLDEDGVPLSQSEVMVRLTGGQLGLFGDVPPAGSSRRYSVAKDR